MTLFLILGIIGACVLGTCLHFTYELFGHNKFLSTFMAVNESTWEHIKIAIVPTLIWGIVGYCLGINNIIFGVFVCLVSLQILIPIIFYTYTSITKKPILVVDIISFYVAIIVSYIFAYLIFTAPVLPPVYNIIGLIGIILTVITLPIFTFFPPKNFLFRDPVTQKYGHVGHTHIIVMKIKK